MKLSYGLVLAIIVCLCPDSFATQTLNLSSKRPGKLFISLAAGGSYSNSADISTNPALWDPAIQGYNASLGNTVLYGAAIGYQFFPCLDADIELTHRPSFRYSKFQTPTPGVSIPGALGTKTRKFDLANTSLLANIILNGRGTNLFVNVTPNILLQPFIGVGAGIAYNVLSDFYSVLATTSSLGTLDVGSIMNSKTHNTFAWQIFIGAELLQCETWAIDLTYRYFDGGHFKTNDYLVEVPVTIEPWSGKLTANEVFLTLKYYFA